MTDIGGQVSAARKAKGWTQDELATAMNVSRSTIANWEIGRRLPDGETMLRLSKALDHRFETEEASSPDEAEPPADAGEPAPATFSDVGIAGNAAEPSGKVKPKSDPRKIIAVCAATLAVVAAVCFLLFSALRGRPVTEARDADGNVYRLRITKGSRPTRRARPTLRSIPSPKPCRAIT